MRLRTDWNLDESEKKSDIPVIKSEMIHENCIQIF